MNCVTIPVSVLIPTRNRSAVLGRTLESLSAQGGCPAELVVVDASSDTATKELAEEYAVRWKSGCAVKWVAATQLGAAVQRNQGVALATQPFILFCDDDILFEPDCVARLWRAMQSDPKLGGVNAMITNQKYHPPGLVSRMVFTLMHGRRGKSFAGKVIGPAVNLLPEDQEDLPDVVPVDWLNLGATIYRRAALPEPVFDSMFTGYSLMEDLTLSLRVGSKWKLANARTARIFHDSQPGSHKADNAVLAEMELVNRHYVMTQVLGRRRLGDYGRLFLWEAFQLAACAAGVQSRGSVLEMWWGKWKALKEIKSNRTTEPK